MPNFNVEFEVRCSCGQMLEATGESIYRGGFTAGGDSVYRGGFRVVVEPCEKCADGKAED